MSKTVYKKDLVLPELSFKIVGCAFDVFNEIGGGHKEKVYQKAMKIKFQKESIAFKEQASYSITMDGEVLERSYFDFVVDEKVVVELKALGKFTRGNFSQVLNYLNKSNLELGLLIAFTQNEVKIERVVNFNYSKIRKN